MKFAPANEIMVTDRSISPGTIFAHYTCAAKARALNRYGYYASTSNIGNTTNGVCEFCKQEWYLDGHKPSNPLAIHFI